MEHHTLLQILTISSLFIYGSTADRSPYAPYPDDLITQVIPAGQPWPSNQAGYVQISQTTQKPIAIVNYLSDQILNPVQPVQVVSTTRPDFHHDPWAIGSTEWYGLGSVQELPFP